MRELNKMAKEIVWRCARMGVEIVRVRYVKSKESWVDRESRKGESRKGWTVRRELLKGVEEAEGRVGEDVFGAVRSMTMEWSFDNWKSLEMEEL